MVSANYCVGRNCGECVASSGLPTKERGSAIAQFKSDKTNSFSVPGCPGEYLSGSKSEQEKETQVILIQEAYKRHLQNGSIGSILYYLHTYKSILLRVAHDYANFYTIIKLENG